MPSMASALAEQIAQILNLRPAHVERSLEDLARQIRRHLADHGEIGVEGLGVFRSVKGSVQFDPDPTVLSYVNAEFAGLQDLSLDELVAYRLKEELSAAEDAPGKRPEGESDGAEPEEPGAVELDVEAVSEAPEAATQAGAMGDESAETAVEEPETSVEISEPEEEPEAAEAGVDVVSPELVEGEEIEPSGEEQPGPDVDEKESGEEPTVEDVWAERLSDPGVGAGSRWTASGMEDAEFSILPSEGKEAEEMAMLRALLGDLDEDAQPEDGTAETEESILDETPESGEDSARLVAAEEAFDAEEAPPAETTVEATPVAKAEPRRPERPPMAPSASAGSVDSDAEAKAKAKAKEAPESAGTEPGAKWPPAELFPQKGGGLRPPSAGAGSPFAFATDPARRKARGRSRARERRRDRNVIWFALALVAVVIIVFYAITYWDVIRQNLVGDRPSVTQREQASPERGEPAMPVAPPPEETRVASDSAAVAASGSTGAALGSEPEPAAVSPPETAEVSPGDRGTTTSAAPSQTPFTTADGDYAWVVASFPTREEAQRELGRYQSAGARGEVFVARVRGQTFYRVAIGRYQSAARATANRNELPSFAPRDAWVRNIRID